LRGETIIASKTTKPGRVLIIDDHLAVREALALRIDRQPDLEVCGEAADIPDALRLVSETRPDVAVVDITLKNGNGLDLIKQIRYRSDQVRIVVWSMHSETLYSERALRAGAMGYVNKDQATDTIIDAIRRVLGGMVYLSDEMADKILHRAVGGGPAALSPSPIDKLADRELEVFMLIGQGVKTSEIARRLVLSVKTVETYRDRIREKLQLRDGMQLVHYATKWVLDNA
jgi:DNA-binding NarL/FixJ family response regulator